MKIQLKEKKILVCDKKKIGLIKKYEFGFCERKLCEINFEIESDQKDAFKIVKQYQRILTKMVGSFGSEMNYVNNVTDACWSKIREGKNNNCFIKEEAKVIHFWDFEKFEISLKLQGKEEKLLFKMNIKSPIRLHEITRMSE